VDRAFGLIEIKSLDDDARVIEGVATHVSPDRLGDIVEPRGASFTLPVPLLWQHGKGQPAIGNVTRANVTDEGIYVRAELARDDEPGPLKDMLDLAWRSIKKGLVRGLSIGFRPLEDPEVIKGTMGLRFKKWELLELSAVTIPAHTQASIQVIKSLTHTPGMTGTRFQGSPMKTFSEQIQASEATRKTKSDEMVALMNAAGEKGETLDADQTEKYDALKVDVKNLDGHLTRLREMEEINKHTFTAPNGSNPAEAAASRSGFQHATPVTVQSNLPPGIGLARVALAKANAFLDHRSVTEIVADRWPDDQRLKQYFQKAAVPAGMTTVAAWAGNLVDQTNLASEFLEFLRPQTIIGRIPNLRRVPFNIRITGQTTGAVAGWVGEAKGKPVTSFSTNAQTLLYTKIAAIAVITQELARFSSPSAEALVRDELARAVIERMDIDFIDPAQAAVAAVNPASITNGVTPLTSAGTSADNIRTDIQNLLEQFVLNNMNATNVVLIMPNTLALAASLLVNSLGQPEFPGLTMNGGTLAGLTVITSQYAANQSGSGNLVIALDPTAILLADDGRVDLSTSMEASIEMSDAPTNASGAVPVPTTLVSMYQTNSIAIKAERFINWLKARTTAVSFIDDVNWGSIGSPS
jgi:HK97 family phage major capsid protein/HK97 family phage prohead protease